MPRSRKQGWAVTQLEVDANGFVSVDALRDAITDQTVLITIMHANKRDRDHRAVEEIGKIARDRKIHSTGHRSKRRTYPCHRRRYRLRFAPDLRSQDLRPQGIGAMYVRKGPRVDRFMIGGGQENKPPRRDPQRGWDSRTWKGCRAGEAANDRGDTKTTELRDALMRNPVAHPRSEAQRRPQEAITE